MKKQPTILTAIIAFLSYQNVYAGVLHENFVFPQAIFSSPSQEQKNKNKDFQAILDSFSEKYADEAHFTGVPLTVQCPALHKGRSETFTTGRLSINGMNLLPKDALFQIGSNSKSFVSVVLLQLEAEGLLGSQGLNSTVGDFFPEYTKWKDITISQLLHMTSGIRDYANDDRAIFTKYIANPYWEITTEDILNSEIESELMFAPGTNWHYSNTNYVLAGKIIEKLTSNTLAVEIQERILTPLKLHHTHYITHLPQWSVPASQLDLLMSGYYYQNGDIPLPPYFNPGQDIRDYSMSWANAAGSIVSNSEDLNSYARALFQPKEEEGKLLTRDQIEKELLNLVSGETGKPIDGVDATYLEGYGLGVGAKYDTSTGEVMYGHGGGTLGFRSFWAYDRAKQISFVNVVNSTKTMDDKSDFVGTGLNTPVFQKLLNNCNTENSLTP
jgi:D-alanyl-D-alanine carboxypeptidase